MSLVARAIVAIARGSAFYLHDRVVRLHRSRLDVDLQEPLAAQTDRIVAASA